LFLFCFDVIVFNRNVTLSSEYVGIIFGTFLFGKEGSYSFTFHGIEPNNSEYKPMMALYKEKDWKKKLSPCDQPSTLLWALALEDLNSSTVGYNLNVSVADQSVYAILLLCDRHESTTFSFTAVFKNGDSHLSKNDIPYPYVYTVFVCLWVVFFIIWLINWIYTRVCVLLFIHCFVFHSLIVM